MVCGKTPQLPKLLTRPVEDYATSMNDLHVFFSFFDLHKIYICSIRLLFPSRVSSSFSKKLSFGTLDICVSSYPRKNVAADYIQCFVGGRSFGSNKFELPRLVPWPTRHHGNSHDRVATSTDHRLVRPAFPPPRPKIHRPSSSLLSGT